MLIIRQLFQGITHILNSSSLPPTFPNKFTYLTLSIRDRDTEDLLSCIPMSNIFIEAGIDSGGVLVHCAGGRSRSPCKPTILNVVYSAWSKVNIYNIVVRSPYYSVLAVFKELLFRQRTGRCKGSPPYGEA